MPRHWYVATTKPQRERLAEVELRKQISLGVVREVFNPRCRVKWPKPDGGERYTIKPYIPGYILVNFDIARDRWQSVNGTRGVGRLLMCGDLPSRIRVGVVRELLDLCEGGETFVHDEKFDKIISRVKSYDVGDKISVGVGYSNLDLTVSRSGHARVGAMLDIFGRRVEASISTGAIMPEQPAQGA